MTDDPISREELERRLPADMLAECDELLAIAEAVEPVVADLAERYYALRGRWDEGHGDLPNGDIDPRMLEASGSDRIGALLGAIVARSMAGDDGDRPADFMHAHGLSGFGIDDYKTVAEHEREAMADLDLVAAFQARRLNGLDIT